MKRKVYFLAILSAIVLSSCARAISPYDAAHGRAKCGRYIGR